MSTSKLGSNSIKVLLKSANPLVQRYVAKLEAINAKLQEQIVDHEAEKVSQRNKIFALEKQRDGFKAALDKRNPSMQLVINRPCEHIANLQPPDHRVETDAKAAQPER